MKKLLSLALVLTILSTMAFSVTAAERPKIIGMANGIQSTRNWNYFFGEEVRPGDSDWWGFGPDDFKWSDGKVRSPYDDITLSDLKAAKVRIRAKVLEGSGTIKDVKLISEIYKTWDYEAGKNSEISRLGVLTTFADAYPHSKPQDFIYEYYFEINGESTASQLTFRDNGTMQSRVTNVFSHDSYVDFTNNEVAYATADVSNIDMRLGDGVSVYTNMHKGGDYWGAAKKQPKDDDIKVISKYPAIKHVYNLETVGVNTDISKVLLRNLDKNYYVYGYGKNGALVYAGRSKELLMYSDKYYLSLEKLSV